MRLCLGMHLQLGRAGYACMLGYKERMNSKTKPEKDGARELANVSGQPLQRISKKPRPLCSKAHGKTACLEADGIWGSFV